jgi:UDP-N-acetylglucosamine transferase subunit ALG13
MILVTVGTHDQNFDRLVETMDRLATTLEEPVIIQRGSSSYLPVHTEHFEFTSYERMQELTQEARVVVSHAAAGAIILVLSKGKPLVLVPRLARYGEAIDDHQKQLAIALERKGQAIAVLEPTTNRLAAAITLAVQEQEPPAGPALLASALREQLRRWDPAMGGEDR